MPAPCVCSRGWICAAHRDQPFPHDNCTSAGRRCLSAICPYWQYISGASKPLALEASVQLDHPQTWAAAFTQH
jgi:hypothetical protein